MAFDTLGLTPGAGFNLAVDLFTDVDAVIRGMPYGAVAFGPIDGPYAGVTLANGLPIQPGTGATFPAVGNVAHDAADSGNPLKIGGKAANGPPAQVTTGNRVDAYFDQRGRLGVVLGTSSVDVGVTVINDGASSGTGLQAASYPLLHNPGGTNFDRQKANYEATALASAARTASVNSSDLVNFNHRGVRVVIDVTAIAATPSVVFTITGKCSLSGKYYAILASVPIVGTGTTALTVYPGITPAANVKADEPLPRIWRVEAVHGDADSITYSVSANYIL